MNSNISLALACLKTKETFGPSISKRLGLIIEDATNWFFETLSILEILNAEKGDLLLSREISLRGSVKNNSLAILGAPKKLVNNSKAIDLWIDFLCGYNFDNYISFNNSN